MYLGCVPAFVLLGYGHGADNTANVEKEATMKIVEFEKAFRSAIESDPMRPALALPAVSSQPDIGLPPEFEAARRSLTSRSDEQPRQTSLLRTVAAQWS